MGITYGKVRRRAQLSDLNRIGVTNSTVLYQSEINGGLEIGIQADGFGCGGPASIFGVEFKSDLFWRQIEIEFSFFGNVACWSIGDTNIDGGSPFLPEGFTFLNNLKQFNILNNKDRVYAGILTYELPQFQVVNDSQYIVRCDGSTNNWGIYNGGQYRGFKMIRTKNILSAPAGIVVGRSCTATGVNGITILKNIYFIK